MQRTRRRFFISLPFAANGRTLGNSRDVSLSGAFINTVLRPHLGTRHHIAMQFSDRTIDCQAQVVRHERDGIAVAFEINEDLQRDLSRALGPDCERADDLQGR